MRQESEGDETKSGQVASLSVAVLELLEEVAEDRHAGLGHRDRHMYERRERSLTARPSGVLT